MIGERLGHWIIEAEIGQNDMGRLFRVRAVDQTNRVAGLRWLTHSKAKSAEFAKLFLAQVELLRKLRHPAIVAVLEGGLHDGLPYYVTEWIDGSDFHTLLRSGEKPAWPDVLAIALQIMPALRHAHRRSVLHRDLKPANLWRSVDGSAKLANFGVLKFFGDALLNADDPLGSAAYLSPEQAAGKPYTKRSDFYGLGCLLWTLIVGRPPFTGGTVVELIQKHCFVLAERPIHFVPDLPEEFDRFVMRLMAKEPAQRSGSGTLLMQELEGIWSVLERRGLVAKRPAAPAAPEAVGEGEGEGDLPADDDQIVLALLPESIPRAPLPWQSRWYVVGPLFAACVLILLWTFLWRGPSADELMANARPLLESNKPADLEKAWKEYLEPLSRKHPGKYQEEVKEARRRIDLQGELNRAFLTGQAVHYQSQAERFYHEGLRLVQAGEYFAARRLFENLIIAYRTAEEEKRWVVLAGEALDRIDKQDRAHPPTSGIRPIEELIRPVLGEIKRLRAAGQTKEADTLTQALEFLYRDEPEIEALRQLLAGGKK